MSSTQLYMSQHQWDQLNQSMSSILGIEYSPSISEPYTVETLPSVHRGCFNKGIPKSEDHKLNLAKANLGKKASIETKLKMGASSKERWQNPEYVEHIRIKRIENWKNNRIKMVDSISQNWLVIDPSGIQYNIKNLREFCRLHNLNSGHMSRTANGQLKQHKGWCCSKATNS